MNHQITNSLIWTGYYAALIIWSALFVILIIAWIKRQWALLKRMVKYLIHSSVFVIAWGFILELALYVRSPILVTKEASIDSLKGWIRDHQIGQLYISIVVIVILLGINLLFYFKIERKENGVDLYVLPLCTTAVLAFSIWLTGADAYYGLLEELNRHFNQ